MHKQENNLRTSERKEVKIPLEITPVHIFTESQILNISKGGVFITTPRPLPTDTEIEVEFLLPKVSKKIRVKGKVKWSIDQNQMPNGKPGIVPGMGVKFIQISKESLKEILKYIKK
jgi:type IV pilus assembly protein PilZ